ncbi:sensor histidine kinase [Undibacterium fentianense]|uniref:histidine kinase n=1 Tax=Undibacterium fentianense TaxID=2828728 RepID=A0A941E1F8_9BURK|nr:ATP-binding protein [Undibacterium fentianense]MBR7800615.1 HAMP domain-containing protein [Undibacterium fentianense]
MTRFLRQGLVIGGVIMSVLLFFLMTATENSSRFRAINENLHLLLMANAVVAFGLLAMVSALLWQLIRRFRQREFGSRIMTRLVILFALTGILPGSLIYLVSVQFVTSSIDSWFLVKLDPLLNSGVDLGHTALDYTLRDLEGKARSMANQLSDVADSSMSSSLPIRLSRLREQMQVKEATIVSNRGRVIATANEHAGDLVPELPTAAMIQTARAEGKYSQFSSHVDHTGEDATRNLFTEAHQSKHGESGNQEFLRVIIPLPSTMIDSRFQKERNYLQVIQAVPELLDTQAKVFTNAIAEHRERSSSRNGLKNMYLVTLTLLLLFAIFGAITAAFFISGELARPLLLLAEGTKAVAEGNLSPRPITTTSDELGSLTQSFNTMTHQLFEARIAVEQNRNELENAKAYLESVLGNMSAGVMVLDQNACLVSCNHSVERILRRQFDAEIGRPLSEIRGLSEFAAAIDKAFSEQHAQSAGSVEQEHWQQQIELSSSVFESADQMDDTASNVVTNKEEEKGVTLLARGSHLPVKSGIGYVIVFDDITNIISAQRSIAWGEVARRLAHEIKNPLTPIQLSAERLQMKLLDKLNEPDAQFLSKSTTTIVNQVTSMKRMVDDFRDYAKIPQAVLSKINLAALIDDVLHLYLSGDGRDIIHLQMQSDLPLIMGDATQLRQVIHNLLQNAQDAVTENQKAGQTPHIDVVTEVVHYVSADKSERVAVRLSVIDNGPGFSNKILARAFEPYATSKPRGTGLGLAMVKKIVDEHGGKIDIQNRSDSNGAKVSILLLKLAPDVNTTV